MKPLAELLEEVSEASFGADEVENITIRGVTDDSREVEPGMLFVAVVGTRQDSHDNIPEAVAAGAAAVVVEREVLDAGIPTILVRNSRRALAELAAAWYDHPATKLRLVGITGTLGKTSVLSMLEAALLAGGHRVATIGSLGIRLPQATEDTGHTVPGPLVVQEALARAVDSGAEVLAMEVTSHALSQDRVHGLRFDLGVFTNLVPLEHMEYHGSFEEYVKAKSRYFDHLREEAPVIYSGGDPVLQSLVSEHGGPAISCGRHESASVQVTRMRTEPDRTTFTLAVGEALPCFGGRAVQAGKIQLETPLLGRPNTINAALAATAALCLGADEGAVRTALARMEVPPRRMKVIHRDRLIVLDDTVGHPDSITAVFEVAERLPHRRLHVVFAIRGQRGVAINQGDAEALSIWANHARVSRLVVTRSSDTADERNVVTEEERDAFVDRLRDAKCEHVEHARLRDAVEDVLSEAGDGDVVLLLGAQGMDAGAELVRERLAGEPGWSAT